MPKDRYRQDNYLVKRVISGDDEAFAQIIEFYKQKIFRLINRKISAKGDVEDLAQEVFLKAYKSLKKFDQRHKFSTWLYTIANNVAIDYLRKKRLQSVSLEVPLFPRTDEKEVYLEIADFENNPERVYERTAEQMQLLEAIALLSEEYSLVIKLRHLKGYTYHEISEMLDLPLGTIKSRIYRARIQLREILQKGGQIDGLSSCL